jgi:uncharacterized protein with FMN-binding domain
LSILKRPSVYQLLGGIINEKKGVILVFALTVLGFVFTGCSTDPEEDNKHPAYGTTPYNGTVTGDSTGYHQGGTARVVIALTLADGYNTAVDFTGSSGNTDTIGKPVIDKAPAEIIAKNSVEIDAVTNATVTWETLVAAGRAALSNIPGYTAE